MGQTLNESLITLIPKLNAEESIHNWRPISLLAIVYKVLATLNPMLDGWVCREQRGFISGRCILDNVHWLHEAKWWACQQEIPTVFLCLDFEKAYDSVRWDFLEECLRHYGFGEDFIRWVLILLEDAGARVIVNGRVTDRVDVGRSVRQGCPLAPALYILLTDYLIHCIKVDVRIKGLVDPRGNKHKVSGLADDMLLALLPREGSLEAALEVVVVFSLASGCLVNWRKMKIICIHLTVTPECLCHITRVRG